mmetsp:Transcript_75231/g.207541  ORF Transcript_75231/g.207541 Transcript_75231/m.207541 type:complete len:108 (+) Transcript_75231:3-326(+)
MPARGKSLRLRGGGCCASKLEEDKEEQGEGLRQTNDPPSDTLAAVEKATAEMKKKEIAEAKEAQRSASPKSPLKPKGSSGQSSSLVAAAEAATAHAVRRSSKANAFE